MKCFLLLLGVAAGFVSPPPGSGVHVGRGRTLTFGKKKGKKKSAPPQREQWEGQGKQYAYTLAGLKKKVGDRTLLDGIDLAFFHGAKIGLVGSNGSGKSTLLKIMAGVDKDFEGTAKSGDGLTVGYLAQEPELAGETVDDAIAPAIAKSRAVLDKFEELSASLASGEGDVDQILAELEKVQDSIDAGDLWELDRRVETALKALRCPPRDALNKVLSGGERRRVAIARLLLENNDMLLLDEPTNHLDAESIAWLEGFLIAFKGTVVVITHDRYFLDRITQWVLELNQGKGLPFEGSYARWLEMKLKGKPSSSLQAELDSFFARSEDRPALARLGAGFDSLSTAKTDALFVPAGPRLGTDVIRVEGVKHAYGDRILFDDVSFEIPRGAIVGVVGPNGAGKSTIVDILSKNSDPIAGTVEHGETVVLATAAQSRKLDDDSASVFEAVTDGQEQIEIGSAPVNSRKYLGWFGFSGSSQSKPVSTLSGGERNRAFLAKQLRANANCLVLDEPTNDLDVSTLRSLEDALLAFAGTVVVVSHDRFFLNRLATHVLAFEPKEDDDDGASCKIVFFNGNWEEYEEDRKRRYGDALPKPVAFNRNQLVFSS